MWTRIAIVAAALALPAATASAKEPPLIEPPAGAKLVGSALVDEIRAFPELSAHNGAAQQTSPAKEKIVGVEGIDRVFEIDRPFGDTVASLDTEFKQSGFRRLARVETPSATAWSVKRPDGSVANAVVRNTTPTTIELTELSAAQSAPTPK